MPTGTALTKLLRDYFEGHSEGLDAVYLYGSVARGDSREDSDVDLGLLCSESADRGFFGVRSRLEDDLEHLLGRSVQAVVLDTASPDFVHRVLRDGVLMYERDPSSRIRFEVSARREYLDLLPVLREYRRVKAP